MNQVIKKAMIVLLGLQIASCTQVRDAVFPDELDRDIYEIGALQDTRVSVNAGDEPLKNHFSVRSGGELRAAGETPLRKAELGTYQGPERLKGLFKNFPIRSNSDDKHVIQLQIDRKFLTAYKVVNNIDSLAIEEQHISEKLESGEIRVPILQYDVIKYGTVQRKKNDLGEDTRTLELKETNWVDATHVQLALRDSGAKRVAATDDVADRIFLKEKVDGALLTRKELEEKLDVIIGGNEDTLYMAKLSGNELLFYEVTTKGEKSSSSLTPKEWDEIDSQDKGNVSDLKDLIQRCDEALLKTLPADKRDDCVVVSRFKFSVSGVVAKRRFADAEGHLSSDIVYEVRGNTSDVSLVQIAKRPAIASANPFEGDFFNLDASRVLIVKEMKSKEYLFRRTLQDSPNGFDYTFPGMAGSLEIVKFVFEKDSVRITRARPLVSGGSSSTAVDEEPFMVLNASYYKKVYTDAAGNPIPLPRLVTASPEEDEAIAFVDWTRNKIPLVNSPLNYYELGQCFIETGTQQINNIDHRPQDGIFNFTLSVTYASNQSVDCAGMYRAGYFDTVQTNFTFDERVSFKEYDSSLSETPLLEVPYEAQKRLGFGMFTYKKVKPNSSGNTHVDGTEIPLPALYDVRQGKSITYVLAGLPTDQTEKDAIIQATKEVIADWNRAFALAFAGTQLERKSDVIQLLIEGQDIAAGHLGDLDRNYIYYIGKKTSSSIIGLGGSHSNPRNGVVEAASTFVYGGNIKGYVETIRKREKAVKEYEQIVEPQTAAITVAELPTESSVQPGTQQVSSEDPIQEDFEKIMKTHSSEIASDMKGYVSLIKEIGATSQPLSQSSISKLSQHGESLAFYDAFRQAVDKKVLNDPNALQALINKGLIQSYGSEMTVDELEQMTAETNRLEAASHLFSKMRKAGHCVFDLSHVAFGVAGGGSSEGMTDVQLLAAIYKPTLAHELGHNLGLRHNFIASFDQANFKFDSSDTSKRDYSSVMDYMPNDHHTYDGLGPHDVAAIRAAYTGLLELDAKTVASKVKDVAGVQTLELDNGHAAPVVNGQYININDVLKLTGLSSWIGLSSDQVSQIGLKNYLFCSDEDAGVSPTCNRFDEGASPQEIVKKAIKRYRALYSLTNFPNDLLRFGWDDFGQYISRVFGTMIPIRMFLEETIYQLILGADQKTINDHASAAIEGLMFFNSLVRTPDMSASENLEDRFVIVKDSAGKPIVVEKKMRENLSLDISSDRLAVRGIEYDKVIALLMLTERRMGFPRYERISLRFSYPEFEKLVWSNQDPMTLPTMSLLQELLSNNVTPAVMTPSGGIQFLPLSFQSEPNEMIRFYGILGGIVNQDVDGLETSSNQSSFFRALSGFQAPAGVEAVVQPGANASHPSVLKYWAMDQAHVSSNLIDLVKAYGQLSAKNVDLKALFKVWIDLKFLPSSLPQADLDLAIQKAAADIDAELATYSDSIGAKSMAQIGPILESLKSIADNLGAAISGGQISQADAIAELQAIQTQIEGLNKNLPVLGSALSQLKDQSKAINPLLDEMITSGILRTNEVQNGIVFSNLETLNQIFFELHPEYN